MSKRAIVVSLSAILILASFLRLFHLAAVPPGLYADEAMDGNNALEAARFVPFPAGFGVFYPEDAGREGLYVNCVAVFLKVSGGVRQPWIVRLPAAISGILTVLGIYFLAAEWFGAEVGLLSAFLLATSFWHITFSRIGFRAIMAPLFLTWSLYFLIKGFRKLEKRMSLASAMSLHLIGGALWALGFYTYIAYRVSPALILVVFIFYWREAQKGVWQKQYVCAAVAFCLSSAIVAAPLVHYFRTNPGAFLGRASQISIFRSATPLRDFARNTWKTLAMFNIRGDANWRQNVSGRPELFWPVGLLFLLGIVVAVRALSGKFESKHNHDRESIDNVDGSGRYLLPKFPLAILFAWFLLAMLPVVISDDILPHALRSLLMIPCVFMFAALGGRALYTWLRAILAARWLKVAAYCFLGLLAVEAYHTYFVVWAKNPDVPDAFDADSLAIGRELNALPAGMPKYVVVDPTKVLARGIPIPAQTVMFITDTYGPEQQAAKNIHYLLPGEESTIPVGAAVFYIHHSGSEGIPSQ